MYTPSDSHRLPADRMSSGVPFDTFEAGLVSVRAAEVDLVARQQIRFPTEPSNSLDSTNERGQHLILHPLHFQAGRAGLEQTRELLVDSLLHFRQVVSRAGSR